MKKITRRKVEEAVALGLMFISLALVTGSLGWILITLIVKGLPVLNWEMITSVPQPSFHMGRGGGGLLNAILGSLYLALGGTVIALVFSLPIALGLNIYIPRQSKWALLVRSVLDILWGIPSIVYGAFGFLIMIGFGLRASLLAGIITLAFVIGTLAVVLGNWPMFWAGAALVVVGAVVGKIMQRMGLGKKSAAASH